MVGDKADAFWFSVQADESFEEAKRRLHRWYLTVNAGLDLAVENLRLDQFEKNSILIGLCECLSGRP